MDFKNIIWEVANDTRGVLADETFYIKLFISKIYLKICEHKRKETDEYAAFCVSRIDNKQSKKIDDYLNILTKDEIIELLSYLLKLFNKCGLSPVFNSPNSLTILALKLLELDGAGEILLDLGSGYGSFLSEAILNYEGKGRHFKDIEGMEINQDAIQISQMVLSCLSNDDNFTITKGNAIQAKPKLNKLFTHGYVLPPFGINTKYLSESYSSKLLGYKFSTRNNGEWLFVDKLLNSMNENFKKCVAIVSPRCMFNSVDKEYRNALIDNGFIEGIIELPRNFYPYTQIETYLLVLSRGNKKVKLIDAKNMINKVNTSKDVILDVNQIVNLYYSNKVETRTIEELHDLSNLTPSNIFENSKYDEYCKDNKTICISDVAEIIVGSQYTIKNFQNQISDEPTDYRILTSSDLDGNTVNWKALSFIENEDKKLDKFAVRKNDIIITTKSSKYKTVVVDIDTKEKVIVTGGMIIIRPKEDKINSFYLKSYLDSDIGRNNIGRIQKGNYIKTIGISDFKKLMIPDISFGKQNRIANKYISALSTLVALKNQISNLENKLETFFQDEMED